MNGNVQADAQGSGDSQIPQYRLEAHWPGLLSIVGRMQAAGEELTAALLLFPVFFYSWTRRASFPPPLGFSSWLVRTELNHKPGFGQHAKSNPGLAQHGIRIKETCICEPLSRSPHIHAVPISQRAFKKINISFHLFGLLCQANQVTMTQLSWPVAANGVLLRLFWFLKNITPTSN